jgi:flagellar biosynthesis/type III secretory pathway protein FliH
MKHEENPPEPYSAAWFKAFFDSGEKPDLTPEEKARYQANLKYYRDLKNVIDTAFKEGKAARLKEDIEKGKEEGKEEKELELILNAHDEGLPVETIARNSKKTIAEVEAILRKAGRL